MTELLKRLWTEDEGMEMLEWAVVAAVFVGIAALGWQTIAQNLQTGLTAAGGELTDIDVVPGP